MVIPMVLYSHPTSRIVLALYDEIQLIKLHDSVNGELFEVNEIYWFYSQDTDFLQDIEIVKGTSLYELLNRNGRLYYTPTDNSIWLRNNNKEVKKLTLEDCTIISGLYKYTLW